MNKDSYKDMLAKEQTFHDKYDFKNTGGEEMTYRIALTAEELGEMGASYLPYVGILFVFSHAI